MSAVSSPGANPMGPESPRLLAKAAVGDRVALARLMTIVERGDPDENGVLLRQAYAASPPYSVGLAGAPGAGKSTLTSRLIDCALGGWPRSGSGPVALGLPGAGAGSEPIEEVAVLAVDPSSPVSGGALLGDRIRMQDHAGDPFVFIRSMATRGSTGGLALAVPQAVRVLGVVGLPLVMIETVGSGQLEVDVASVADTAVVVVTPGWGDAVQAAKAGLLELADIFVVNKADRPGADEARRDLEAMLELPAASAASAASDWTPPIVTTVATTGEGVEELWAEIARHRAHLTGSGLLAQRRHARLGQELRRALTARLMEQCEKLAAGEAFADAVKAIADGRLDPYAAALELVAGPHP